MLHFGKLIKVRYHKTIELYFQIFSPENCLFFFLENDSRDLSKVFMELCNMIETKVNPAWECRNLPRILSQKNIPQYFFHPSRATQISCKEGKVILPPKTLYIASDGRHEIISNVSPSLGGELNNAQRNWTNIFSEKMQRVVFEEHFLKDIFETT